jgi:hypothetical protein
VGQKLSLCYLLHIRYATRHCALSKVNHAINIFLLPHGLLCSGFTVDEGPLRDLESPQNKKFVEELMRGFVPEEVSDCE